MPHLSSTTVAAFTQPTQSSDDSSSPNSPVGSPPLILAFLAIGIFSAAMIAVYGWRRVQFGRGSNIWRHTNGFGSDGMHHMRGPSPAGQNGGEAGSKFGEKPVLWEARTDRSSKVKGVDYGCWDNTMPLAVLPAFRESSTHALVANQHPLPSPVRDRGVLTSLEPPLVFQPQQTTSPSRSRARQRLNDITSLPVFRRYARSNAATDIPSNSVDQEHPSETDKEDKDSTRVVIIIEMPSPASSRYRHTQSLGHNRSSSLFSSLSKSDTLVDNTGRLREDTLGTGHDSGQFQYCFGVHTCPWPRTTTDSMTDGSTTGRMSQPRPEKDVG